MQRYEFYLRITPEAYLDYYRGLARFVVVESNSGQTLKFPASFLRNFVSSAGIEGNFVLVCDANNKCVDLQRLAR